MDAPAVIPVLPHGPVTTTMSHPGPQENRQVPGLLVIFIVLAVGIVATGLGYHRTQVALLLCATAGVGWLWWRQQSSQHRETFLAAQALRGSDARYRSVVDSANDAIVTVNTVGEIVSWNAAAGRVFRYTANEILGQSLARILAPDDGQLFLADLPRLQAGGSPPTLGKVVEQLGRRKDGSMFSMELSVAEWQVSGERFFTGTMRDITERKTAENSLRLQSAALTATANAIVIADRQGTIVWVNPAFTSLTGYPLEEAVGKNPRDLVKSGQQERAFYENLWQTIASGQVWRGELVNRRKDGSLYPEEQTITPLRNAAGEITHFIAVKQDLTERHAAEFVMQESRRRFQAVFEQAAVGMVIAEGADGRIINVNRRFCGMLGRTVAELTQLTSGGITHPDDVMEDRNQMEQLSRGTIRQFSREKRFLKKDGAYVWVRAFVASLDSSDPAATMRIGVFEDITERKTAERLLREQAEIIAHAHEGVMIVNLDNQITLWNHGAERMFGWSGAEALGRSPDDVLGTGNPDAVSTLRAAVERDGFWNGEMRGQTRDGRTLNLDCRTTLVRDAAGRPRARLNFFSDITEKKLLEEKFLHAQRLESIGMLAAGIAHDLNNVLAPIMFAGPLLRNSLTAPRELKILDLLEKSAARGAGLVKQILGFAHSTTGEIQPTQLKHLMRDIAGVIEETFPKSIRLEQHIPSDLWVVLGNPTQIHQVLLNLCVNARDAMPQGGTLRLSATNRRLGPADLSASPGAQPGAWLMLEVSDTGTGIPPELVARIWDPFFTTKGAGKGTGLGLSTVRSIVASHRGFVELHTALGQGTTFRVFFPVAESELARPGGPAPASVPHGHGELILVVDDDAAIRDIVAAILTHHGYRVERCADGIEALAYFGTHPGEASVVVTDVDMPRLGGVALARALLQLRPDLRVLAMSGLSRSATEGTDLPEIRTLAHAFLLKPFQPDGLLAAIHTLLHPAETPEPPCPPS